MAGKHRKPVEHVSLRTHFRNLRRWMTHQITLAKPRHSELPLLELGATPDYADYLHGLPKPEPVEEQSSLLSATRYEQLISTTAPVLYIINPEDHVLSGVV